MKLRTVIIEDSHENIDTLTFMLKRCPLQMDIIGKADNIEDALTILSLKNIDMAFLDIQLGEGLVFQVLEKLLVSHGINFEIVFVTAHTSFEYATKAIQFACLDFITKPVSQEKLDQVILKAVSNRSNKDKESQIRYMMELLKENLSAPRSISIVLPKGIIEVLPLDDISHIEADGNTSLFHLTTRDSLHSVKPLAHYLELMGGHPEFRQISRNCLVNMKNIRRYDHRHKELVMITGEKTVVSHRYSVHFRKALLENESPSSIVEQVIYQFKNFFTS